MKKNLFVVKKRTAVLGLLIFFCLFGITLNIVIAEISQGEIALVRGKNYLTFDQTFFVSELVLLNPEIEYVSYYDDFLHKSIGYVNVFGGVGSNFVVKLDKIYEISVSKNMSLILPQEP